MTAIHHTVVAVSDLDASLRFYRDGLGLDVLRDAEVEGDWPELFGAPARRLHAVFLGDADVPDVTAGVLELVAFPDATLGRLAALELGGAPRRVTQATPNGAITIATVVDPDGVVVLLTPGSITQPR